MARPLGACGALLLIRSSDGASCKEFGHSPLWNGRIQPCFHGYVGSSAGGSQPAARGRKVPGVNYLGGSRQLRRRVPPPLSPCDGRGRRQRKLSHPLASWSPIPLPELVAERTSRRTPRSDGSAEPTPATGAWVSGRWRVIDAWSRRRISPSWGDQGGGPACGGSSRH